jgi:hypothetical protein
MGILTSQKIAAYYDLFKSIDVTFSKEIIQVTGLIPNQVYLKCVGDFWPCVVFSTSFQSAKIVVNIKSGILQKLERANNMVSLRFCFKIADKANPVAFFVNSKSIGYAPYGKSPDMAIFTLQFTQRPPDDLIEIIGRILDANVNSAKRREERIPITTDSARKMNLVKESAIYIQGIPRHCILRDISFSGVKIIMMGVAKFLLNKEAVIKIDFEDPKETFLMKGTFIRSETVEGRKELVSLVILFDETIVPMGFKIRINDYISQVRVDRGAEKPADAGSAAPSQAPVVKPAPPPNETAKTEPAKTESVKTEPAKAESVKAEPAKTEPDIDNDLDLQLPPP